MTAAHRSRIFYGRPNGPFLGEVTAADFITGSALASAIGLTAGYLRNDAEPWLKFKDPIDGKTKLLPRKHIRVGLSWNQLSNHSAVHGTQVTIQGQTYIVRLPRTRPDGSALINGVVGYDHQAAHGSEWNRLMYHISGRPFNDASNTLASEGLHEGDWAQYSEVVLDTLSDYFSLCQEKTQDGYALIRGEKGVSYISIASVTGTSFGWRPVLELVEQ